MPAFNSIDSNNLDIDPADLSEAVGYNLADPFVGALMTAPWKQLEDEAYMIRLLALCAFKIPFRRQLSTLQKNTH